MKLAFAAADTLKPEQKREILERAFQVNEIYVQRWPRFADLQAQVRSAGAEACAARFNEQDWRDLQLLSQLAWMDEEYIAKDPVVNLLAAKGTGFTERDKQLLREKQLELLGAVLPEYRIAAESGQIEISTTPYYHPILPLLCDTDIARISNPHTPLPQPPFRFPGDAREQLLRARKYHERVFGKPPAGLWPSEGSVSDESLEIAVDLGFKWFATDEGVLGRTRNIGFWRDAGGYPENGPDLYSPWKLQRGRQGDVRIFPRPLYFGLGGLRLQPHGRGGRRGGFAPPDSRHRRSRAGRPHRYGEHHPGRRKRLGILPGKWTAIPARVLSPRAERYGNSRAHGERSRGGQPQRADDDGNFPRFMDQCEFRRVDRPQRGRARLESAARRARSVRAGRAARKPEPPLPRNSSAPTKRCWPPKAAIGTGGTARSTVPRTTPNSTNCIASTSRKFTPRWVSPRRTCWRIPIKKAPELGRREPPESYLDVTVDGRETSYFEWLGAGLYATDPRGGTMHGRTRVLGGLYYGFSEKHFYLRVDPVPEAIAEIPDFQLRLTLWDSRETRITVRVAKGKFAGCVLEQGGVCLLRPETMVTAAFGKIIEVGMARELFDLRGRRQLLLSVALWEGGLPIEVLPVDGMLELVLGEENFAWGVETEARV